MDLASTSSARSISHNGQSWTPFLRLIGFLTLHLIMIAAEIFAMLFFMFTGNYILFLALMIPFCLSGLLCTLAAWQSKTPVLGCTGLPLSQFPFPVGVLLAFPFGLFQGVIVILELEEFCVRRQSVRDARERHQQNSDAQPDAPPWVDNFHWVDKFHCKAINGAFEGLISCGVVLFGYWGVGFPRNDPVLKKPSDWNDMVIQIALNATLTICSLSTALCVLELDFDLSPRLRQRMRCSWKYEIGHAAFRIFEVWSRWSLLIGFAVLTYKRLSWWWAPIALDIVLCIFLVDYYGGCEVSMIVRVICAVPCVYANVFRFVDSPFKRRAARKLTKALAYRNLAETILLPALYFLFNTHHAVEDARQIWHGWHGGTIFFAVLSHPLYWLTLWYVRRSEDIESKKDIFSACETGDVEAVMDLTTKATVGIDLNIYDIDGKTPLMLAVTGYSPSMSDDDEAVAVVERICELLVEQGARLDLPVFEDKRFFWNWLQKPMRRRWTPLHLAASQGCLRIVRALVDSHRNFGGEGSFTGSSHLDTNGDSPIHIAAYMGHSHVVGYLLGEWPVWANIKNLQGRTPLEMTTSAEVTQLLQENSASSGETPLLRPFPAPSTRDSISSSSTSLVRLPIVQSFSQDHGLCRAPGLSSYVVSVGGGNLGKVFLTTEMSLPTIDESTVLESGLSSGGMHHISQTPASQSDVQLEEAIPTVSNGALRLQDLEPVDKRGCFFALWRSWVQSYPFDARLYLYIGCFPDCILGEGSYGSVWRARDRNGQWYAVKNIKPSAGPIAQRECDMSDHLRISPHPCIVRYLLAHSFREIGLFVLVMEFCPRGDLLSWIEGARNEAKQANTVYTPPPLTWNWIGQIFLALEHLHLRMHALLRDLKPENVVISERRIAKLTDFGFGRFDPEQSTGAWSWDVPPGTPGYIAPELLKQKPFNFKADLYSFGVLMWVALTGGVTSCAKPRPPVMRRRLSQRREVDSTPPATSNQNRTEQERDQYDYAAHERDYKCLEQCIDNPEGNFALPLDQLPGIVPPRPSAKELVKKLIQFKKANRPDHAEIRQYEFMQQLELPEFDATEEDLENWLSARED